MEQVAQPAAGLPPAVDAWLKARRQDPACKQQAVDLLGQMIHIDTTPKASPRTCAEAEAQVFDIIEAYLTACSPAIETQRVPIREAIADHPYFTVPYYAAEVIEGPGDLDRCEVAAEVYRDRGNLFVRLPNPGRQVLAINAHVDTVRPYIPLRVKGDIVYGRGAVDDKGPCLAMMLAVQYLTEVADRFDLRPACELLLEFVIDEETGGNGSLSAALEKDRGRLDAIVVLECTGMQISPANRGVVWYQTQLNTRPGTAAPTGRDILLEASAFVVGSFGRCGDRIKAESDHPLFPHRPVQTCHGIIGPLGQHPSRVNDYVPLRLTWSGGLGPEVRRLVDEALADYCARYGDKTRPGAGDGAIEKHVAWSECSETGALLEVFGLAGHMGSVDRLDGAITKAATIVHKLVTIRQQRGGDWACLAVTLKDRPEPDQLTVHPKTRVAPASRRCDFRVLGCTLSIEGGQGFLPTHCLQDVADRMRQAARQGVEEYLATVGLPADAIACETRFDKLHNDAFARPADGPAMRAICQAGRDSGVYHGEPIRGWDVSCDARIFAREFPAAEVITFGPGSLSQAHANDEHGDINDVLAAAETLVRTALAYGTR